MDLTTASHEELIDLIKRAEKRLRELSDIGVANLADDIKKAAQDWGLPPEDIIARLNERVTGKASRAKGVIRFRHPEDDKLTWSGMGRKPNWVVD